MKKYIILIIVLFVGNTLFAQNKPKVQKAKDSIIKTEVVEVVTTYAPKVTDAYKIKRKPAIKLSKNAQRKKLDYKILSIPVVSTFTPKSGVLKGIDVGDRERLFNNYISAGFGNNTTPFVEAYFHNNNAFEYEYGGKLHFISSTDPVKDERLSSSYYDASVDLFLKQEMRYFDWKVGLNASRNKHNWYGLPDNIVFLDPTINRIEEEQTYKYYNLFGSVYLQDSNIKEINGSAAYFSDALESDEIHADVNAKMSFPLGRFGLNSEDFELTTSVNFILGGFDRTYNDPLQDIKYNFITGGIKPSYAFQFKSFDIKLGAKAYYSFETESGEGKFFVYPDAEVNFSIIPRYANIYVGATGDLQVNSFKSLTDKNPHVSPTLNLRQTSQAFNAYGGFRGILGGNLNYNVKASFKKEENKPLFVLNESISNGITTAFPGGVSLKGYQYGNSFDVIYNDVNTFGFAGEVSYDFSRKLNLGLNVAFNKYDLAEEDDQAWNLPELTADIFATYKVKKWYAGLNLYFIGSRKGVSYDGTTAARGDFNTVDLDSYIDLNVNGGYHFNDLFSVFLKANNITDSQYQNFTNFNAQGLQVLGGIIYKFDSLF